MSVKTLTDAERSEITIERLRALEERLRTDDALFLSFLACHIDFQLTNRNGPPSRLRDGDWLDERKMLYRNAIAECFV